LFVKITTSGTRQYVKLVEAFRDAGGISCQRVIATLGRLETIRDGDSDSHVNGQLRASVRRSARGRVRPALSVLW
jgi:hypothetical protein